MRSYFSCVMLVLLVGCHGGRTNSPHSTPTKLPVPATTDPAVPRLSAALGEPIELFNRRNLDGWVWVQRAPRSATTAGNATAATRPSAAPAQALIGDVWSVRDSVLHTVGRPIGYIRTERAFDNYVLIVEQRHVGKGNGGILFAISGEDKVWPHCLEVQGQTSEEGDVRNVAEFRMTTDPARLESRRLRRIGPSSERPPGEWETIEIIVDHGNLVVAVNGVLQNVATQTEPLEGHIGLQAEGGEMEFRKIELRPIVAGPRMKTDF